MRGEGDGSGGVSALSAAPAGRAAQCARDLRYTAVDGPIITVHAHIIWDPVRCMSGCNVDAMMHSHVNPRFPGNNRHPSRLQSRIPDGTAFDCTRDAYRLSRTARARARRERAVLSVSEKVTQRTWKEGICNLVPQGRQACFDGRYVMADAYSV